MTADRILECPFCVSSDVKFDEYRACMVCINCETEGPFSNEDTQEDAIELWNRRTGTVYNGKTAEEWYTMYCQASLQTKTIGSPPVVVSPSPAKP